MSPLLCQLSYTATSLYFNELGLLGLFGPF